MFTRILFPTNFEEFSLEILKTICCLRNCRLEEVVLLHMIDVNRLYTEAEWGIVFNLTSIHNTAAERLSSYAEYLGSKGIKARTVVSVGPLVPGIMRIAQEENVSLIVAGRQRRSRLGDLLIGSTADRIIREARLPVLVAKFHAFTETRGQVIEKFCSNMFRKILYAVDWSPWTERAKDYLKTLRQIGASEVLIVHVVEDLENQYEPVKKNIARELSMRQRTEQLEVLKKDLEATGLACTVYILEGDKSHEEINRIAAEEDVSMIIMGSHGKGFVEKVLWGSVSQRVVESSHQPILVVK
ncbi:MAG TPA: universal stress protein [Desulfomonilaceae bacterium]|nr:universal stress protein [Desulfomonilaceae bacterium]